MTTTTTTRQTRVTYIDVLNAEQAVREALEDGTPEEFAAAHEALDNLVMQHASSNAAYGRNCDD